MQLAAGLLKELLSTTGVAPEEVNEVILGQVGEKILIVYSVLLLLLLMLLLLLFVVDNDNFTNDDHPR